MSQIEFSQVSILTLIDRAIEALTRSDAASAVEVLTDCDRIAMPVLQEEFSRALAQKVVFEKLLEQTNTNLRVLRGQKDSIRYGRQRQ